MSENWVMTSFIESQKDRGENREIQRCKKILSFLGLFAFGSCTSKTRKSRFIRLAAASPSNCLPVIYGRRTGIRRGRGIGRDGRGENAPEVFGHNGTLGGNKRANGMAAGTNVRYFSHFGDYGFGG